MRLFDEVPPGVERFEVPADDAASAPKQQVRAEYPMSGGHIRPVAGEVERRARAVVFTTGVHTLRRAEPAQVFLDVGRADHR